MKKAYIVSYDYCGDGNFTESGYFFTVGGAKASMKHLKRSARREINYYITEYELIPNGVVFRSDGKIND